MIDRLRSTVICLHQNKVLGFRAEDPTSKQAYVFLPGGKIEAGETARESAEREAREETGYEVTLLAEFELESTYPFFWDGQNYLSRTIFFAGNLKDPAQRPAIVEDTHYHRGVIWIDVQEIKKIFGYQKEILKAVEAAIQYLLDAKTSEL